MAGSTSSPAGGAAQNKQASGLPKHAGSPLEIVKKAGAFLTKGMRLDCAHNLCAFGAQIPHLRGNRYVSGQQSRRITWISILFRPAGRNSTRLFDALRVLILANAAQSSSEVQNPGQHHDGDGVQLRFAQQEKTQRENCDHEKIGASKHQRAPAPERVQ